jgi:hypothetical protein
MGVYKNDYTKEEDRMLWELHEIRHALAEQHQSPEQINAIGHQIIAQYHLNHLKIVQPQVIQPKKTA